MFLSRNKLRLETRSWNDEMRADNAATSNLKIPGGVLAWNVSLQGKGGGIGLGWRVEVRLGETLVSSVARAGLGRWVRNQLAIWSQWPDD